MDNLEEQKIELELQEAQFRAFSFFSRFNRVILFLIIVFAVFTIPIYFVAKYSVAALYMRNFYKRQISAHPASFVESNLPVQIVKSEILPISGDSYSAYAIINNPYVKLSAPDIHYTFHFLDSSGNDINEQSGDTFLLAGDKNKLIIIPNVRLKNPPASLKVEIDQPDWKYKINLPNVLIQTDTPVYSNQQNPNGFYVSGNVRNNTIYNIGSILVRAAAFDKDNNIIAVTQTVLNTINPHEIRAYKLFWPILLGSKVSRLQVYAETDVFDPQNIY